MIHKVLIANRGEIAVRIVRACRQLGVEAVIGVSEADRESLAAKLADRAVCIGPTPAVQSYLRMDAIVTAAKGTGCDAIHPGDGFLSERAEFQRLCVEHTTIPFHQAVLAHPDFAQGRITTRWVEESFMKQGLASDRAA